MRRIASLDDKEQIWCFNQSWKRLGLKHSAAGVDAAQPPELVSGGKDPWLQGRHSYGYSD